MEKEPKVRKAMLFTQKKIDMANIIIDKQGYSSFTEVCSRGIEELYDKYTSSYRSKIIIPNELSSRDIIQTKAKIKIDTKIAEKKYEEDVKWEKKTQICEEVLGGEVESGDFGKVCRWTTYSANGNDGEQAVPLAQVHEILATNNLFFPNKEAVLKARPDLRKRWTNNEE